jgi:hypothetical protein
LKRRKLFSAGKAFHDDSMSPVVVKKEFNCRQIQDRYLPLMASALLPLSF